MSSFENPIQNKNEEEIQSQVEGYAEHVSLSTNDAIILQNVSQSNFKNPEDITNSETRTLVEQHKLHYLEYLRDQAQLFENADSIQKDLQPLLQAVVKLDNSDYSYISTEKMEKLEQETYYHLQKEILRAKEKLGHPPAANMEQEIRDLIARKLIGIASSKTDSGDHEEHRKMKEGANLLGSTKSTVVEPFLSNQINRKRRVTHYYDIDDELKRSLATVVEDSNSLRKELFQELHKRPSKEYFKKQRREAIIDVIAQITLSNSEKEELYELYTKDEDNNIKGEIAGILGKSNYQKAIPAIEASLHSKNPDADYVTGAFDEIRALGQLGNSSSIPIILPFLENSESYINSIAIRALGDIGDSSVVPKLLGLLDNDKQPSDVINALGSIKDKRAIEPLLSFLERPENDQFSTANDVSVSALLDIGQPIGLKRILPLLDQNSIYTIGPLLSNAIEHEQDIHTLIKTLHYRDEFDTDYKLILSRIQEIGSAQDIIQALQTDKMSPGIMYRLIWFLQSKGDDEITTIFLQKVAERGDDFPIENIDDDFLKDKLSSIALRTLAKRQDFPEVLRLYSQATSRTQEDVRKDLVKYADLTIPLIESNEQYYPLASEMAKDNADMMYPHLHRWIKNYADNRQLCFIALEYFSYQIDPGKKACSFLYKLLREHSADPSLREKAVGVFIMQNDSKAAHLLNPIYPEYLHYFERIYDNSKQCHKPLEQLVTEPNNNFNNYAVIRALLFQEKESGIPLAIESGHISIVSNLSFAKDISNPELAKRISELNTIYGFIGVKIDELSKNLMLNFNEEEDRKFVLRIAKQYKNRANDVFNGIEECYSEGILHSDNRNEIFPYMKGLNMITPLLVRGYIDARNKDAFFEQIQETTERLIFQEDSINLSELTPLERNVYQYLTRFDVSDWKREQKNFDSIIASVENLPKEQRTASSDFSSLEIVRLKSVPKNVNLEKFKEPYAHIAGFLSEALSYKGDTFYQQQLVHSIESDIEKKQSAVRHIPEKARSGILRSIDHLNTLKEYVGNPESYKHHKQQQLETEREKLREQPENEKTQKEKVLYENLLESTNNMSHAEILIDILSAEKILLKNNEGIAREIILARHLQGHKKQLQEIEDLVARWNDRLTELAESGFTAPHPPQQKKRDDLAERNYIKALDIYEANIQPILEEHPIEITKIEQVLELFGTQIKDHVIGDISQPEHGEDWQYPGLTQRQREKLKRIFSFSELTKAFDEYRKYQGMEMPDDFYLLPSRSILGETSGYYNDACWTSRDSIIQRNSNMTPIACARKLNNNVDIIGGGLVFENSISINDTEEKVLVVRGINLQNRVLEEISADSYCEQFINRVKQAARKKGIHYIMADTSSGIISNRPGIADFFKSHYPTIESSGNESPSTGNVIPLNEKMDFNNYHITSSCQILEVIDNEPATLTKAV